MAEKDDEEQKPASDDADEPDGDVPILATKKPRRPGQIFTDWALI